MLRELTHVDGEIRQVPFDAHQKEVSLGVLVFVGVERIAVSAINEIVDRGIQAFLIGAADEQDGGVFHPTLPPSARLAS
jgi:hypothetical protein